MVSSFNLKDRDFWIPILKFFLILIIADIATASVVGLIWQKTFSLTFAGVTFIEASLCLIFGASLASWKPAYTKQGIQAICVGVILFIFAGFISLIGWWFGI